MLSFNDLDDNFKFLVAEVSNLVEALNSYLNNFDQHLYQKIVSREDYIDNLKTVIENKCFSQLQSGAVRDRKGINKIRSVQTICVNLERIADYCVNILRQVDYLKDHNNFRAFDVQEFFDEIKKSLPLILPGLDAADLGRALTICQAEYNLDTMYKKNFDSIMKILRTGHDVEDLITILFILRYLERIGDSLLNIGEALLFVNLGEKIKITQFRALQKTLDKSGFSGSFSDIDYRSFWGTRSGCNISWMKSNNCSNMSTQSPQGIIFKGGAPGKIRQEKENIERWQDFSPGLVPKIFSFHEEEDKAALLEEFLPGCTLDEIILTADDHHLSAALAALAGTLGQIWTVTRTAEPRPADYTAQLLDRLESIRAIHPALVRGPKKIGATRIPSTEELLGQCRDIEQGLSADFAVFIHGDLNINNIIYDAVNNRVHFIDLYRSKKADYIQDASVLLISLFRLPIFEAPLRERINISIGTLFDFIAGFARENADRTFSVRMALALTRSFYTSTRFELNEKFAREMFLRAHYLMEKIIAHQGRAWEDFVLPAELLFYRP